jgi:hypothetical protein
MQALPIKGKDYADLTTAEALTQKRYYKNQMAPIYMRVTSTGMEEFAALPPSVGMFETSAGGADPLSLYAAFPLPTLPSKAVRPGDSWQTSFLEGELDLSKYPNITSITKKLPARGEFVGVEWEKGHPCAKIRKVIEAADVERADNSTVGSELTGEKQINNDKVSITETIWFALDSKKILKIIRDTTIDRKTQMATGGFPGLGGAGGPAGGRGPGAAGPGVPGGRGGLGPSGMGSFSPFNLRQRGGAPQAPGTPGQRPGVQGGPGIPGGGLGGQQQMTSTFVRLRMMQTFTLEM